MEVFDLDGVSEELTGFVTNGAFPPNVPEIAVDGSDESDASDACNDGSFLDEFPEAYGPTSLKGPSNGTHHNRTMSQGTVEVPIGDMLKAKSAKKTASDFSPLRMLGAGAYGKVLLVKENSTGRLYAQKQLKKASIVIEQRRVEQTMSERQILEACRHPYIVKLHYAIQDNHKLYLLLQYAPGGELFTHLASERMFSEDVAAFYIAQMATALRHLHSQGIVYRDLKPENRLLDESGHLLLTDFGLSKNAEGDSSCNSLLGTPEYMAPEVLMGKPYDYSVDWWSLGAVMFDLLTGSPPFTGNNHKRIIEKITTKKLPMPYYLSEDAKDLLRRLLRKEPSKRLSWQQWETIKKHRFFRKLNWSQIESRSPDLIPPIRPIVTDPALAENFSSEFTSQTLSPPVDATTAILGESGLFQGFSYVGSVPSALSRS